ncbi:MAG: replication protein [Cocleimonas sp.]|nr:replication protein [Cocleimonas sp.]
MQAILYATTGDIAPKNSANASHCAKNKLNLLPEHLAQIGTAFIHQLSLAPLTARDLRILTTLYDQTIAYDKREDDMNGTRLEQLTGIRRDHANESVRRLVALNIILTHQGHYGKWMAINFDFPNWGKPSSDTTTNDPRCLLSDVYQSALIDERVEFQLYSPPEKCKKEENSNLPPSHLPAQPSPDHVKPAPVALHFPHNFPKKLRQLMIRHLAPLNIPQHAQRLLDYFAKCLRNGKIRNPIAYFISLKNRWLRGSLDLNEDQATSATNEKKGQQERIKQRMAYQQAVADIKQLKKSINAVVNQEHCRFDQALKKMKYTELWAKAIECLEQTKKVGGGMKAL